MDICCKLHDGSRFCSELFALTASTKKTANKLTRGLAGQLHFANDDDMHKQDASTHACAGPKSTFVTMYGQVHNINYRFKGQLLACHACLDSVTLHIPPSSFFNLHLHLLFTPRSGGERSDLLHCTVNLDWYLNR